MKFYYPVILRQLDEARWHGRFPDLAMCEVTGDSVEDVLDKAVEAARDWIDLELNEEDPQLPAATDPVDIPLADREEVREILINYRMTDGWEE